MATEKSEGEPFYLVELIRDILDRDGVKSLEQLAARPKGVNAYLQAWYDDLRTSRQGRQKPESCCGYLYAALGPIRPDELIAIDADDGLDEMEFDDALELINRYVTGDDEEGLSLTNERFRMWLEEEHFPKPPPGIATRCCTIAMPSGPTAGTRSSTTPGTCTSETPRRSLCAGRPRVAGRTPRPVRQPALFRRQRGPCHAGCAAASPSTGRSSSAAACSTHVRFRRQATYRTHCSAVLAQLDRATEAVGYVMLRKSPEQQVAGYMAVAAGLLASNDQGGARIQLEQARQVAESIENPYAKASALAGVASALAATDAQQARQVAEGIEDAYAKASALAGVASVLVAIDAQQARQVAQHALHVVRASTTCTSTCMRTRRSALAGVARVLAAIDTQQARQVAEDIWTVRKARALAGVASALAATDAQQARQVAKQALQVAEGIEEPDHIAMLLASTPAADDTQRALQVAKRIDAMTVYVYVDAKASALAGVAEPLPPSIPSKRFRWPSKRFRWPRASRTRTIKRWCWRWVRALASFNTQQALQVAAGIEARTRSEGAGGRGASPCRHRCPASRQVAEGIEDPFWKARALADVASALAAIDAQQALQ